MAKIRKLEAAEIEARLKELPAWTVVGGKLRRELRFADFVTAFGFMSALALVAESRNHHPEWFNVYGRVVLEWNTHDVGGLSERDFELAAASDRLAARFGGG
jgi:4a-hydroxytetrahydrobiopterin dehydratase